MKKLIFIYDIDGTLAKGYMQNDGILKVLGESPAEFWAKVAEYSRINNCDHTLAYLYLIKTTCESKGIKLTRRLLFDQGKTVKFFDGVEKWFDKINKYAAKRGVEIKHYAVSTGNKETVEGMKIAKYFDRIYGCEYLYDENGEATWVKVLVNYTLKTQYIFRIRKDALDNQYDDKAVNKKLADADIIPFENMTYFGDGFTDIPAMRLLTSSGGNAIGVYDEDNDNNIKDSIQLLDDKRINYRARADYTSKGEIYKICTSIIDKV